MTLDDLARARRSPTQPRLGQLVEDDDRQRRSRRRRPSARAGVLAAIVGAAAAVGPSRRRRPSQPVTVASLPPSRRRNAMVDRAAVELDGRPRTRRPAGRRSASVGERLRGDRGEVRGDRRATAADPQLDPVVELEPGLAAQVLDRALRARGRRPRRAARASAAVSMTTTRPSSSATAVPGRGVAWISTSSGASVTPASVTEPSASNVTVAVAGRRHDRRDRRPEALADLRQQRLDPPLDELGLVADDARPP